MSLTYLTFLTIPAAFAAFKLALLALAAVWAVRALFESPGPLLGARAQTLPVPARSHDLHR